MATKATILSMLNSASSSKKIIKNNRLFIINMEAITIPKEEYELLKRQARIDLDVLHQLMSSFKDIKEGNVRRVR